MRGRNGDAMRNLMVLGLASLPLLPGGCAGEPEDTGYVENDVDVDADADTDESSNTNIEVPFSVALPEGVTGEVSIYVERGGEVTEDPVGSCKAGKECTYTATETGVYWVGVDSDLAIFLAKSVVVSDTKAVPDRLTWNDGGCTVEDGQEPWTPESHAACPTWTPGEWGLAPNGIYYCETCGGTGYDSEIMTVNSADVTGDGFADIKLTIAELGGGTDFVVSGLQAYSIKSGYQGALLIEENLSSIMLYTSSTISSFEEQ